MYINNDDGTVFSTFILIYCVKASSNCFSLFFSHHFYEGVIITNISHGGKQAVILWLYTNEFYNRDISSTVPSESEKSKYKKIKDK